jgi:hypothetical protein
MFVRKLENRSGSISVQVIQKYKGKYSVIKSMGSSKDPNEIEQFLFAGRAFIQDPSNSLPLFSTLSDDDIAVEHFLQGLSNETIRTIGPEIIFGTLFDRIGYNAISDELFRHLVIARLA